MILWVVEKSKTYLKLWNLLLRSGPQKNREKLEFITAIWTNKFEVKEFITAMEYRVQRLYLTSKFM